MSTLSCFHQWFSSSHAEIVMSDANAKLERRAPEDIEPADAAPSTAKVSRPRTFAIPLVITLAATALAIVMGSLLWDAYMAARRNRADLRRDHGPGGRGSYRAAAGEGQPVRSQGRSVARHRSHRLQERIAVGGSQCRTGPGKRAQCPIGVAAATEAERTGRDGRRPANP